MTLRQEQPVISGVIDQASAGFHQPLLKLVVDQWSILFGSTSRRHRFPRF
jgi:hypothetical protein